MIEAIGHEFPYGKVRRNLKRAKRKPFKSPTTKILIETVELCLEEIDNLSNVYAEVEIMERILESMS